MKKKADPSPATATPTPDPDPARFYNGIEVKTIATLDELQAACDRILHVKVMLPAEKGVQMALIPVRMLRPNESERLELILKEAHPPLKDVLQPDGSNRKEYIPDQATLEKAAHLQKIARAMALWWACPLFQSSEDGKKILAQPLKEGELRNLVFEFVQSKFTESILEKLYSVIRSEEFTLEDRVNFTTPPA